MLYFRKNNKRENDKNSPKYLKMRNIPEEDRKALEKIINGNEEMEDNLCRCSRKILLGTCEVNINEKKNIAIRKSESKGNKRESTFYKMKRSLSFSRNRVIA